MGSIQPAALQGAGSAAEMFCCEADECFSSCTWYSFHCRGKHVLGEIQSPAEGQSESSRAGAGVKLCLCYVWKGFPPQVVVYEYADVLITQFLLQISVSQVTGISAWRRQSV